MARKIFRQFTFLYRCSAYNGMPMALCMKNYRFASMGSKTYFRRFKIFAKLNKISLSF